MYVFDKISAWAKTDYDRIGKRPKYFATDTGLMANLLGWDEETVFLDSDLSGKLVESWVYHELSALADAEGGYTISQYRDKNRREVDGVVSNQDKHMATVAYVAQELHLVGNPVEAIETCVDKAKFRAAQERLGLYAPKHFTAASVEEFEEQLTGFPYPLIVKPMMCAGSSGVKRFDAFNREELRNAYFASRRESRNGIVAVEEFIEARDNICVETDVFVANGQFLFDGIFTTTRSALSPLVPTTCAFLPDPLPPHEMEVTRESIKRLFQGLGIVHGEYNVEAFFTKKSEFFIVEVNPRQGGDRMPQCLKRSTGIDYNRLLVTTTVGDFSYWESLSSFPRRGASIIRHDVFVHQSGVIAGLEVRGLKGRIVEYSSDADIYEEVVPTTCNSEVLARLTLAYDDREACLDDRDHLEARVVPILIEKKWYHSVLHVFYRLIRGGKYLPRVYSKERL